MEILVFFGSWMGLLGFIGLGKSYFDWFIFINVYVLKRDYGLFLLVYMY